MPVSLSYPPILAGQVLLGFMRLSVAQSLTLTAPIATLPTQPGFQLGSMPTSTRLQMSFTQWKTRQRKLGPEFDSVTELVSMLQAKIDKARGIVASAYPAKFLTRKAYRSLMGNLRHVTTCLRAA
ncbi:hypothetical protein PHPALM_27893 [Phytophthora palmivora]|uniref:Uncharacterized protein n=1 Tax=Phytophthora palmivora TaxID=4796 RepID=A0A2P4XBF6_9STRA|nr:hypothetical protein PHPALM_27893 [Phytophthora palmivora]